MDSHPTSDREGAIVNPMPEGKVWTADELLAMTPNERHAIVKASIVTDLDEVPPEFLERVRANIREHIAATEGTPTDPT
jgi:hypothetical protein